MRISDWSSDVCSSDLAVERAQHGALGAAGPGDVCVDRGDPAQAHVDTAVLRQYADAAAGTRERGYTAQQQDNEATFHGALRTDRVEASTHTKQAGPGMPAARIRPGAGSACARSASPFPAPARSSDRKSQRLNSSH